MEPREIAKWIIDQNIKRKVNSYDIKEIGELIFGITLTSKEVAKVKYYLTELGYFEQGEGIRDSKLSNKQKFWYAERLENYIEPRVLKKNYIIKVRKSKKGSK